MQNIVTALLLTAMLSVMVMTATPVSAEDTTADLETQCAMSGGVLAEDYSCVPASFYAGTVECTECETDADYRTALGESGQI